MNCLIRSCDRVHSTSLLDYPPQTEQNGDIMGAKTATILSILFLSLNACVSYVGPEGPQGRDGRDGQVDIYNGTFTIDSDTDFGIEDEFISVASYAWNVLDEFTVDEGVVLAYIRFGGSTAWHALPLTTPFEDDQVILRYGFDIDNFDLILEGEQANNHQANEGMFDGDIIRVVAIPPSILFKGKNLDYTNYEAVKTWYGLID